MRLPSNVKRICRKNPGDIQFLLLQALNFSLEGKLSLCDLTVALENELLGTKNGIHQAALASFKAEIRHLLFVRSNRCQFILGYYWMIYCMSPFVFRQ